MKISLCGNKSIFYRIIEIELLLSILGDGQKIIDLLPPTTPLDISDKGPSKSFVITALEYLVFLLVQYFYLCAML